MRFRIRFVVISFLLAIAGTGAFGQHLPDSLKIRQDPQDTTFQKKKDKTGKKDKKSRAKKEDAEADTLPDNVLLEKQWSVGLVLHTNGYGLRYRRGHNITALHQFMWEVEISNYKAAKEVRTINPYFSDSKSYVYGKLNHLYFIRGGVGSQHILTRKPYWGGVQLSALYYGGVTLGIAKPIYLYIIYFTGTGSDLDYEIRLEKYNPELHFIDNIYGRAPFLSGWDIKFYPGVYGRGGLDFEFGTRNRAIKSLEVGAQLDYSPIPIPVMAENPKQSFFLTLYLAFHLGKRL